MSRQARRWVLPVSFLVALLLGLVLLPAALQPLRPYWLALVLVYWLLEAPERVGMGTAFGLGLAADIAFGGLLGEQALRLVVMAFIVERFRARLRFFPVSQQAFAVGALLLNDRVINAALHVVRGVAPLHWSYWLGPLIGLALWPPLRLLMDSLRLRRRG